MGFVRRDDASSCSDESGGEIFKSIPKNSTAFCIWKIEGLRTISLGRTKVGTFISDSAYLIYTASARDGPLPYPGMPTKELKESDAVRAIHLWVGSECDASVSAGAALRAAELDSQLPEPGATLLIREAQGREGARFLGYFRQRHLAVVLGRRPDPDADCTENLAGDDGPKRNGIGAEGARLHRVSGTGLPVLTELGRPDWSLFSSRHVLLLHVAHRSTIFLWLGANSEPLHKSHAVRLLEEYTKNDKDKMSVFVVEDGYEKTLKPEARKLFDEILDPAKRFVAPDPSTQAKSPSSGRLPPSTGGVRLYKCSEQGGKYKVAELKSGAVWRSELESDRVYLLDRGELAGGVWAWVGSLVPSRERLEALRNARGFVKKRGYGADCAVGRALEGREPPELRAWIRGCRKLSSRAAGNSLLQQIILPASFEPDYMSDRPKLAAECHLVDDGSAERQLWLTTRCDATEPRLEPLPTEQSVLYAEACYVLRYKYGYGRTARTIVYCWEGAQSQCADRKAALEAACHIAEEESAQLVRTSQGKEPAHLLQIYKGKLTILAGPHRNSPPRKYLVRVYGSTPHTSKAVERPLRASSLDARGVFILFSGSSALVWCGSRSTGDAREASRRLAPPSAPLLPQGREDDEFWAQLGGEGVCNAENKEFKDEEEEETDTHLYHLKVEGDAFVGEEIVEFSQSNLLPEAAWLLDAGNMIWIWIGNLTPPKFFKEYVKEAKIFLYTHPASRDRNTIISVIRQGKEPPTFIGKFDNWNHNLLRDYKNVTTIKANSQDQDLLIHDIIITKISNFDSFVKYPLTILKSDPEQLPSGIDPLRKEMHLTYDDFMSIFKMKPTEFEKLPTWRRKRLKQNTGLF